MALVGSGSDLEVLQWGLDRSDPGCQLVGSSNVDAAVGLNVDRRADGTRCPPLSDRQNFALPWSGSISLSFGGGSPANRTDDVADACCSLACMMDQWPNLQNILRFIAGLS